MKFVVDWVVDECVPSVEVTGVILVDASFGDVIGIVLVTFSVNVSRIMVELYSVVENEAIFSSVAGNDERWFVSGANEYSEVGAVILCDVYSIELVAVGSTDSKMTDVVGVELAAGVERASSFEDDGVVCDDSSAV